MDTIVSSFEAIAGEGAAASYAALTIQAMSKHFSNLRDAIITQLNALSDSLSKDQPKRQKKETLHQLGMIQIRQVWRPLRGLPGESVSLLRSWLFEHFLHPYPTDNEKRMLDSQTGLTRSQVKLWCGCPFWPDDGMCRLRDCSVCECPDSEFPEPFKKPSQALPADDLMCQEGKPEAVVDRTLDSKAFRGWIEVDNPWTYDDETDNDEMTYVNLQLNPERYNGYVGPSARRIWDAIYTENCPKYPSGEFCLEKRVMYKLISGLHSSISVHIASDYLLDETKNLWGPNLTLLYDRVLQHPDRVRNLYFTFLFVLRAVTKATDYLEQAEYDTGNPVEDLKTQSLVRQLVYNPKLQAACPLPYDEAKLWQGESGPELMEQIQKQFRNIRLREVSLMGETSSSWSWHRLEDSFLC